MEIPEIVWGLVRFLFGRRNKIRLRGNEFWKRKEKEKKTEEKRYNWRQVIA